MPEGPSIVIAKENLLSFKGKTVEKASGNLKTFEPEILNGDKIIDIKSWGKHLLICFKGYTVRIHFLMFGKYLVNESRNANERLSLKFKKGEINFYTSSIVLLIGDLSDYYDWSADVMNDKWNGKNAIAKLEEIPDEIICDSLLDQQIFAGVGNIIKNEILFRSRVHPESETGKIPTTKTKSLVKEARDYSFDFLKWKKKNELKKHWEVYTKKICPRCKIALVKEYCGKTKRRTFFCNNCMILYK